MESAVTDDLTYCIDNQYMPDNTLTENYGRPSKGAAYALRGMAYMWKALTDEDGTTPEQDYESACKDFDKVDDCGYDLWDDGTPESYLNFFKAENEKDNEMIFAIQFSATDGYSYDIQQAVGPRDTWDSWDEVKPSADFVDYFQKGRRHSVQLVRMGRRAGNLRMGRPHPAATLRILLPRRARKRQPLLHHTQPGKGTLRSFRVRPVLPRQRQ